MSDSSNLFTDIQRDWETYRSVCFLRRDDMPVWVWAADHEFQFRTVAEHLMALPFAGFVYDREAFRMTVFGAIHVVPIARMSTLSLMHLQGQINEPLLAIRETVREAQHDAEMALRDSAPARLSVPLIATESADAQPIH